jgi:hypothetical protein
MGRVALAMVVFAVGHAHAQPAEYQWEGNHACVVEAAVGALAYSPPQLDSFFNWTNVSKSFVIQIRNCGQTIPAGWKSWCAEQTDKTQILQFEPRQGRDNDYVWRERPRLASAFTDNSGDVFVTLPDGGFQYSHPDFTAKNERAWFLASSTCSPVER